MYLAACGETLNIDFTLPFNEFVPTTCNTRFTLKVGALNPCSKTHVHFSVQLFFSLWDTVLQMYFCIQHWPHHSVRQLFLKLLRWSLKQTKKTWGFIYQFLLSGRGYRHAVVLARVPSKPLPPSHRRQKLPERKAASGHVHARRKPRCTAPEAHKVPLEEHNECWVS